MNVLKALLLNFLLIASLIGFDRVHAAAAHAQVGSAAVLSQGSGR
ncbi:hypothetical protein [Pseudomonas sp. LRF_L74]